MLSEEHRSQLKQLQESKNLDEEILIPVSFPLLYFCKLLPFIFPHLSYYFIKLQLFSLNNYSSMLTLIFLARCVMLRSRLTMHRTIGITD